MICKSEDESQFGMCKKESVCYEIECMKCKEEEDESVYIGETSRSAYERLIEHERGHRKKEKDNPLWKHDHLLHKGEKQGYRAKVLSQHRTPLERQIREFVNISNEKRRLMNSKNEWNGQGLTRLTVEGREEGEKSKREDDEHLQEGRPRKRKKKSIVMITESPTRSAESSVHPRTSNDIVKE